MREGNNQHEQAACTTVLVVEDETVVRRIICRLLTAEGYRVLNAPNPAAALELVAGGEHFDLLLSDIDMPKMTGWELAAQLKGAHPEIKVLYTSGYPREAIAHDLKLDAGALLLPKPFTLAELAGAVQQALAQTA